MYICITRGRDKDRNLDCESTNLAMQYILMVSNIIYYRGLYIFYYPPYVASLSTILEIIILIIISIYNNIVITAILRCYFVVWNQQTKRRGMRLHSPTLLYAECPEKYNIFLCSNIQSRSGKNFGTYIKFHLEICCEHKKKECSYIYCEETSIK